MEEQIQVAEKVKEAPWHHFYVTVGHPLSTTAVVEKIVVKVIDGKSERQAAINTRNDYAKHPQRMGYPEGIVFAGQDLYYAIFHSREQEEPDEHSANYAWRKKPSSL